MSMGHAPESHEPTTESTASARVPSLWPRLLPNQVKAIETPPVRVFVFCALGVSVAAWIDYITGLQIRTYPLYFLPIAYGAWHLSRRVSVAVATLCAAGWLVSNLSTGENYANAYVWPINFGAQLAAFTLVAALISELRTRLTAEQNLARLDGLTGLLNTRAFHERAELLVAVARRAGTPFTLAYLDLDNFKQVNDQHGHDKGDEALKRVATLLTTSLRAGDVIARLGGDEFAVMLSGATHDTATSTLERLRQHVQVAMAARHWPITMSIGALSFSEAPASLADALKATDALMYRAKQGGKNRVHCESATTHAPQREDDAPLS